MKIKNRKSRGRTGKNRLTGRTKKKRNVKPAGWLNKNWDENKSGKYNYEQLGLMRDPQKDVDQPFKKEAFAELIKSDKHVPTEIQIQDWQKKILEVLVKKYRRDYGSMARDIKINTWQWTKTQIRKMIEATFTS